MKRLKSFRGASFRPAISLSPLLPTVPWTPVDQEDGNVSGQTYDFRIVFVLSMLD
jgi:hypothetical protein